MCWHACYVGLLHKKCAICGKKDFKTGGLCWRRFLLRCWKLVCWDWTDGSLPTSLVTETESSWWSGFIQDKNCEQAVGYRHYFATRIVSWTLRHLPQSTYQLLSSRRITKKDGITLTLWDGWVTPCSWKWISLPWLYLGCSVGTWPCVVRWLGSTC